VAGKARVIDTKANEFQSLFDKNTAMCHKVVQNTNQAVNPSLRFAKALEIDCYR